MTRADLKPCAHCGGTDFDLSWGGTSTLRFDGRPSDPPPNHIISIRCRRCPSMMWGNYRDVVPAWNRRTEVKDDNR